MGRIKTVFGRHWVMLLDGVGDRYLAIEVQKRKNLDFTLTSLGPGNRTPDSRRRLPCDPHILSSYGHSLHHTAILWTRLHGVPVADRPEGWSTASFGCRWT